MVVDGIMASCCASADHDFGPLLDDAYQIISRHNKMDLW